MSRYDHKIESYLEEIDHLSKQKLDQELEAMLGRKRGEYKIAN